jgi:hypothetical protein
MMERKVWPSREGRGTNTPPHQDLSFSCGGTAGQGHTGDPRAPPFRWTRDSAWPATMTGSPEGVRIRTPSSFSFKAGTCPDWDRIQNKVLSHRGRQGSAFRLEAPS